MSNNYWDEIDEEASSEGDYISRALFTRKTNSPFGMVGGSKGAKARMSGKNRRLRRKEVFAEINKSGIKTDKPKNGNKWISVHLHGLREQPTIRQK